MRKNKLAYLGFIAAAAALTACAETGPSVEIVSDEQLNSDIVTAAGEAISADVIELIANESFAGLPAASAPAGIPGVTVTRTRTCYDTLGAAQTACDANTTASVLLTMNLDGSFSRSHTGPHGSESMSIALHRARSLTISGLAGTETSRTHDGDGTGSDTTVFSGTNDSTARSRTMTSASLDSVQAIVFALPRSTNPWPTSGVIVRRVSGKVVVVGGPHPGERTFDHRITVTFPADAQGNVTITFNTTSCTLNLVTRVVANCSA